MLDIDSLLLPGENPDLLLALQREWYSACDPVTPTEIARVNDAITTEWLFERMDRRYRAMRDPNSLDTDSRALRAIVRRHRELSRKVAWNKKDLGYLKVRVVLDPLLMQAEDVEDLLPSMAA